MTGLGGLLTMPVTVPAGVTGLYLIGTRMSAGIAHLRGYDIESEQVRSVILLSLVGTAGAEALKKTGIVIGEKGVINLHKAVPLVGGPIGAAIDAKACRSIGNDAKNVFEPIDGAVPAASGR